MNAWQISRKRNFARGGSRALKRVRRRALLKGGNESAQSTYFRTVVTSFAKDIAFLFASHWRYPTLAPYIIWFCKRVSPGCPVERTPQNLDSQSLLPMFESLFKKPHPELDRVMPVFDSFFGNVTCELQSARYDDVNWLKNLITLRFINTDGEELLLMPGKPEQLPITWQKMPDTILIGIDTGEQYSVVRVNSVKRSFQADGSFTLCLTGREGHTHQDLHAPGLGPCEELRPFPDLRVVLRVFWAGPTDEFRSMHYDAMHGGLIDLSEHYNPALIAAREHIMPPENPIERDTFNDFDYSDASSRLSKSTQSFFRSSRERLQNLMKAAVGPVRRVRQSRWLGGSTDTSSNTMDAPKKWI